MTDKLTRLTTSVSALTEYVNSSIISKILNEKLYLNEPYKFIYTILFKSNNGLDTANLLINNLPLKPHLSDSAFLILRTILSDCLTYDYLLSTSTDDTNFIHNIKRLYYDHVSYTDNNLSIYSDAYKDSAKEREVKKLELRHLKNEYFDSNGNPLYQKLNISASKAIKHIINNRTSDKPIDYPLKAFNYYDIFSKYEHLGDSTFYLIHRQFNTKEVNDVLSEFYQSINIITNYMGCLILAFESKGSATHKEFCLLKSNIENTN